MSAPAAMSTHAQREPEYLAPRPRLSLSWGNSYWIIALIAVLIGMLAIMGSLALDWVIHGVVRQVFASDFLEGAVAALASGAVMIRMQARRRELLVRMQIVEDVNHHVRNALTAITLSSSLRADPELNAQVRDACDRIDWVLSDALSQTVGERRSAGAHARWRSGRRLARKT